MSLPSHLPTFPPPPLAPPALTIQRARGITDNLLPSPSPPRPLRPFALVRRPRASAGKPQGPPQRPPRRRPRERAPKPPLPSGGWLSPQGPRLHPESLPWCRCRAAAPVGVRARLGTTGRGESVGAPGWPGRLKQAADAVCGGGRCSLRFGNGPGAIRSYSRPGKKSIRC